MAQVKNLRPILWTLNVEDTLNFYTTVLEFSIVECNEEWQWASLEKDGVEIMFSKPVESHQDKMGCSGSFYFNVDNVKEIWEDLKDKVEICYPLESFDWGMEEFAIYDNNGYILQFGETI